MKAIVIAAGLLLAGCSSTNLADIVAAAGTNQATICARVTSVYGTLTFLRSNVMGGDVSCDTLSIKTQPQSVPLAVTPTFTLHPNQ